jgi:hypothetical protein
VRRRFNAAGRDVLPGTTLSIEEVKAFPNRNLRALVDANFLDLFPIADNDILTGAMHVIHRGSGRYDVIRGHVLNAEPLTREAAEAMAGDPAGLASAA